MKKKEVREAERERERALERDGVTQFLLSLAPAMRHLSPVRQSCVRFKMQEVCHEAEFGAVYSQP